MAASVIVADAVSSDRWARDYTESKVNWCKKSIKRGVSPTLTCHATIFEKTGAINSTPPLSPEEEPRGRTERVKENEKGSPDALLVDVAVEEVVWRRAAGAGTGWPGLRKPELSEKKRSEPERVVRGDTVLLALPPRPELELPL